MKARLLLDQLISNPKKLFLIDSSGAMVTAFLSGVILVRFEEFFGMPRKVLLFMSLLAAVYAVYSMGCFLYAGLHWRPLLNTIAVANLVYCFITVAFIFLFFRDLTTLALTYFFLEMLIVGILVFIELKAASQKDINLRKH
jgi:CHASE2 domain-containing sensor protein